MGIKLKSGLFEFPWFFLSKVGVKKEINGAKIVIVDKSTWKPSLINLYIILSTYNYGFV